MVGFLVVFRPWWPNRWQFFKFSALFIFFCFLLYFLIPFAFSFRKIINFLLVPLVLKFENTFFVFLFCFVLYLFYFVSTYNKILIVAIFNYFLVFFCFLHYLFSFVFCCIF